MRVRCVVPFVVLMLAYCVSAGQDPRSVDLTLPPQLPNPLELLRKEVPSTECSEITDGGTADGIIQPEDGEPRDILVEIVKLKNSEVAAGGELDAQVRLQNTGKHPIRIPWSTDPAVINNPRDPEHLEWESGTFQFSLTNEDEDEVSLVSLTGWLYGTKTREGTELTLQPRDSVTASVRIKLEDRAPIEPGPIKSGDWQLSAEWLQMGRAWQVRECRTWNRNFLYQDFYRQKTPAVAIRIIPSKPPATKPAS